MVELSQANRESLAECLDDLAKRCRDGEFVGLAITLYHPDLRRITQAVHYGNAPEVMSFMRQGGAIA